MEHHCSFPQGGLFNHLRNLVIKVEEQGAYTLHFHALGWCWELPSASENLLKNNIQSDIKNAEICKWMDQVKSVNAPTTAYFNNCCPNCENVKLIAKDRVKSQFKSSGKHDGEPYTCYCPNCDKKFGSLELNYLYIDKYARLKGIQKSEYEKDYVDKRSCSFHKLDLESPLDVIIYSLALINLQYHYWHHAKSCFKKTRRTPTGEICRFFFPKIQQFMETHFDELENVINQPRNIGNTIFL